MERYIAIDDVCAWPNLSVTPSGTLLAVIFNQPTHGGWEGDVECWASSDGGRQWNLAGVPAPHDAGTNRMNVAAGPGFDGTMVVLASGWSRRNRRGDYSNPHVGEVLPSWICVSGDEGRTWAHEESRIAPPAEGQRLIPFGDVVQPSEGVLGACLYTATPDEPTGSFFYASEDNGASWVLRGTIRASDANETAPVVLCDGRLLAAVRTAADGHLDMFESTDSGASWQLLGAVTQAGQHPGHLLELADGSVLLTYGIRNRGLYGVASRRSTDGGRSWDRQRLLVNLTGGGLFDRTEDAAQWYKRSQDVGYPASAELADGTLVTVYYCNGIPEHRRYHMGALVYTRDD
jgi:hypothetical protein